MGRLSARSFGRLLGVIALVVSLAIRAEPALGAMCFDVWTDPARPLPQAPTTVLTKEQWAVLSGDTFDLVTRLDGMPDIPIRLFRMAPTSLTWSGQVVFPVPGEWKLRVAIAVPENHYPCFEKTVSVVATSAEQRQTPDVLTEAPAIAAMLGLIAVAAALAIRPRR